MDGLTPKNLILAVSVFFFAGACGLPQLYEQNDKRQEEELSGDTTHSNGSFDIPPVDLISTDEGPCAAEACILPVITLRGTLAVHPASLGINTMNGTVALSWGQSGSMQLYFSDVAHGTSLEQAFALDISDCTEVEGAQSTCIWETELPASAFSEGIFMTLKDTRTEPLFESTRTLLLDEAGLSSLKTGSGALEDGTLYAVSRESVEHLAELMGSAYDAQSMRENGFIFGNAHNPSDQPQSSVSVSSSSEHLDVYYTNYNYSMLISKTCMPGFFFIVSHDANTVSSNFSFSGAGYSWSDLSAETQPGLATVVQLWAGSED